MVKHNNGQKKECLKTITVKHNNGENNIDNGQNNHGEKKQWWKSNKGVKKEKGQKQ